MKRSATRPGRAQPLGATVTPRGVQFALFSRHATAVSLLLFDTATAFEPVEEIPLDPYLNRTGDIWHIVVVDLTPGVFYLYRVDGPWDPAAGHRFNRNKLVVDPYARAFSRRPVHDRPALVSYDASSNDTARSSAETNIHAIPKGIVVDSQFDWGDDRPLNYPLRRCIIYEGHLRGLTRLAVSPGIPGTYRGMIDHIPYLQRLGITSLELLPIQEFDEREVPRTNPDDGSPLRQYWGYSTIGFFAPQASYAADGTNGEQVSEFKEMVRELHRAGIEVILDVVYNHTAEGNELGPTYAFRGLDNSVYYILDDDRRYYKNFSGCGNTLNCNHPVVRNLILDSLHYWVMEMHVDGFRFDLGSVLGRDSRGRLLENPPTIERIAEDPVLRDTKIIAEAWDAAGAYQVGEFPGGRWAEWNDRFRDGVRRFWRGDAGSVSEFATRISGSSDLFLRDGRKPFHSINFVTSHDGFTLNDVVSYNEKHNEANGEDNRDGHGNNLSFNYGVEGPTDDQKIEEIRNRQAKNMLATLLLSLGTPMMLAGDEIRRTQRGNNNAYCQDNELSWVDYSEAERHPDVLRFTRLLIAFRRRHPAFQRPEFYTGRDNANNRLRDARWYSPSGGDVEWGADSPPRLALQIDGHRREIHAPVDDDGFYIMFNGTAASCSFALPEPPTGTCWHRVVDTARESPGDIVEPGRQVALFGVRVYTVAGRSFVMLMATSGVRS